MIADTESAVVRVFYEGRQQAETIPELWLESRHSLHLPVPIHEDSLRDMAILTTEEAVANAEESK